MLSKILFCFSAVPCLLAIDLQAACPHELKVMTFNLRYDSGGPGSFTDANGWNILQNPRSARIKNVIHAWNPDIIGAQEVLSNQIKDLSEAWPSYDFWGVRRDDGKTQGEYAGIYYSKDRFQFQEGGHFWLSNTPEKPGTSFPRAANNRMASWVRLLDTVADRPYFVVNTHWDHVSADSRKMSAALMVDRLETSVQAGDNAILLGDLNGHADSSEFLTLKHGLDLVDAYRAYAPQETSDEACPLSVE